MSIVEDIIRGRQKAPAMTERFKAQVESDVALFFRERGMSEEGIKLLECKFEGDGLRFGGDKKMTRPDKRIFDKAFTPERTR